MARGRQGLAGCFKVDQFESFVHRLGGCHGVSVGEEVELKGGLHG